MGRVPTAGLSASVAAASAQAFDLLAMVRPVWSGNAACRDAPPDVSWFPDRGHGHDTRAQTEKAKAICATCPVLECCRSWALNQGDRLQGIWGGLTEKDRVQVRLRR
jgi:WhiB family transcriptional regulator, redox-sensing transcriptional regulator